MEPAESQSYAQTVEATVSMPQNPGAPLINGGDAQSVLIEKFKHIGNKCRRVLLLDSLEAEEDKKLFFDRDLIGPAVVLVLFALLILVRVSHPFLIFLFTTSITSLGGFLVAYNAKYLGAEIDTIQLVSLLGYCMIPINVAQVVIFLIPGFRFIADVIIVGLAVARACQAAYKFISMIAPEQKTGLVFYPVLLWYSYVGWLALTCELY